MSLQINRQLQRGLVLVGLVAILSVYPVTYLLGVNLITSSYHPSLSTQWADGFTDPRNWAIAYNPGVMGSILVGAGILLVNADGYKPAQTVVTATRTVGFPVQVTSASIIKVEIQTSNINTAGRVAVWINTPSASGPVIVLLKTYNDRNWHTELIDLAFFRVTPTDVYKVELGMFSLEGTNSSSWVIFRNFSFNVLLNQST